MKISTLIVSIIATITAPVCIAQDDGAPYGSSKFTTIEGVDKLEQLKMVFDFNFADPHGIERALYPVSITLQTIQEYGPVSFEPYDLVVVSHGPEVVAFARQNYQEYKDIVDRVARLAQLGVKFEVCSVAADALGFGPDDFHEAPSASRSMVREDFSAARVVPHRRCHDHPAAGPSERTGRPVRGGLPSS